MKGNPNEINHKRPKTIKKQKQFIPLQHLPVHDSPMVTDAGTEREDIRRKLTLLKEKFFESQVILDHAVQMKKIANVWTGSK
jgi:hypothetical protein